MCVGDKVMVTFGSPIGKPFGPDTYDVEGRVRAVNPDGSLVIFQKRSRRSGWVIWPEEIGRSNILAVKKLP